MEKIDRATAIIEIKKNIFLWLIINIINYSFNPLPNKKLIRRLLCLSPKATSIVLVKVIALNILTKIPISRVRAKPLIILVPNQNNTTAEMTPDKFESRIGNQARLNINSGGLGISVASDTMGGQLIDLQANGDSQTGYSIHVDGAYVYGFNYDGAGDQGTGTALFASTNGLVLAGANADLQEKISIVGSNGDIEFYAVGSNHWGGANKTILTHLTPSGLNTLTLPNETGTLLTTVSSLSASNISSGSLALARLAQSGATSGQAIVWNGTAYAPATVSGGSGLTIGTTTITSGTSGRLLSNTTGVLSEVTTTGSGSVVLATSPSITGPWKDSNGNNLLGITASASAVNYLNMTNAAAGGAVILEAIGSSTNVGLTIKEKGAGESIKLGRATNAITINDTANTTVESLHCFWGNPNGVSLGYGLIGGNGIGMGSAASIVGTTSTSTAGSVSWKLNSPSTGILALTSADFSIATVGKGLKIAEGTNAKMGTATLTAGTVTISNTTVTANSRFICFPQSLGTIARPAALGCTARSAGTSFTITSGDASDTSTFMWIIIEPN